MSQPSHGSTEPDQLFRSGGPNLWLLWVISIMLISTGLFILFLAMKRSELAQLPIACILFVAGGGIFYMFRPNSITLALDHQGLTYTTWGKTRRTLWRDVVAVTRTTSNPNSVIRVSVRDAPDIFLKGFLQTEGRDLAALLLERCAAAGNKL